MQNATMTTHRGHQTARNKNWTTNRITSRFVPHIPAVAKKKRIKVKIEIEIEVDDDKPAKPKPWKPKYPYTVWT